MANSWFQFKQFLVNQDRCAMKVSTDAVLLGAKASSGDPKHILDIGAGTGVISLMLAQRFPNAKVTGIELDKAGFMQCKENFMASIFSDRLQAVHSSIQGFIPEGTFDLIVSNPPFFSDHLKSNDLQKNKALHTDSLSFEDLVKSIQRLLSPKGEFWCILPPRQMKDFCLIAKSAGLHSDYSLKIFHNPKKKQHREIQRFSWEEKEGSLEKLYLRDESEEHSLQYKRLLSEFLLDF
ncbi:tRNA1(Val) (adenine(37)-N6)-methyltransferase [Algoriphagus sediminis]|uniref:tRNA1(Val) (adenine(37)-N6)-methyltransferase n=1 Tax=Algoriphagus sediminis TaxID=3057113 RepID=A0ABT7YEI4_9BACT|nr:methyltransferase [Algoriphagus sediminis]MDN3204940.1 methyltransferase [Algoriphagus sediminis]